MDRMRLTAEKATHEEFTSFCGEVVAVDHLEEVSGLTAQGSGSTWTDVHREVWIRPCRGVERKFTFTNVDIAVRIGHHVTLLLGGERPVAVINFSTEQYVNLVMPRWFELFNAAEAFGFAALLIGAGLTAPAGFVALLMGAGGYGLVKWLVRQRRYRALSERVEAQIQRTIAQSLAALADDPRHRAAP